MVDRVTLVFAGKVDNHDVGRECEGHLRAAGGDVREVDGELNVHLCRCRAA